MSNSSVHTQSNEQPTHTHPQQTYDMVSKSSILGHLPNNVKCHEVTVVNLR